MEEEIWEAELAQNPSPPFHLGVSQCRELITRNKKRSRGKPPHWSISLTGESTEDDWDLGLSIDVSQPTSVPVYQAMTGESTEDDWDSGLTSNPPRPTSNPGRDDWDSELASEPPSYRHLGWI